MENIQNQIAIDMQPVQNQPQQLIQTTVFDLRNYANGTLVRLPDFADGQPFVARMRRPSLLKLAKEGKIPNELLTTANSLFKEGGETLDETNTSMLSNMFDVMKELAAASLIAPTYDDIINAGMELSDNQLTAIFSYTQQGVEGLKSFR